MRESAADVARADSPRVIQALSDGVDEARVEIIREEDVVRDTTVRLAPTDEETRVSIELEPADSTETLSVQVELLADGLPAFRGDATASVEVGSSAEVHIEPEPIPAGVSIPEPAIEIEDVGESVQLDGHVVSVTGDPIRDAALTWETLDPEVVDVTSDGLVTALEPGEARVVASHGAFSDTANVRVGQVRTVVVEPDVATLRAGQRQQFSATALDGEGNPIPEQTITWTSSNTEAATVDEDGLVAALAVGETVISASSEGVEDDASVTVVEDPIDHIDIRPDAAEIVEGETVQLTATPRNGDGEPLPDRPVSWESLDTEVATVDATGLVTGVAEGGATIRASAEDVVAEAEITVSPASVVSVVVDPAEATLEVGEDRQFTATPLDSNDNPLEGRSVSWSLSPACSGVATVDDDGLVHALAPGQVTIRATSEEVSGEANVNVVRQPVDSVVVEPTRATIDVGEDQKFTATTLDSEGNPLTGREVTWASSNTQVATVNANGRVTGVAEGDATITATSEDVQGEASVTVRTAPVADVIVKPRSAGIVIGGTVQLTATPMDSRGNPLPDRHVTWTSSDAGIARVSATGLVTGVASGRGLIQATSGNAFAQAIVTVSRARISGTVSSDYTGEPLAGARVELVTGRLQPPRRTTTDQNGSYRFDDVEPGNYAVHASADSHVSQNVRRLIREGDDVRINFLLKAIIVEDGSPRKDP